MIELKEAFERARHTEPEAPSVDAHLAAGQRLVRRRRARVGVGVASVAVAGGVALSALGMPGTRSGSDPADNPSADSTASDPASAPNPTSALDLPLHPDPGPYTGWIEVDYDSGEIYRLNKQVEVLKRDDGTAILDSSTGKRVGNLVLIHARHRDKEFTFYSEFVNGEPHTSGLNDDSWADSLSYFTRAPLYYDRANKSTFQTPFGIDADGNVKPMYGATVADEGEAKTFSTTVFDGQTPHAGVVEFHGRRYYALVGYRATMKDVIVGELAAPGQSLDAWLAEVNRRMDAGEDLAKGF